MKMDKDIKQKIDTLHTSLAKYLIKQGNKYVNDNYYLIESFINTLLSYDFHVFLKDKSNITIDSAIREWIYQASLPNSLKLAVSYFVKSNFDIVGAYQRYVNQSNAPIDQFDKLILSDQETKVELAREYNSKYENEYLSIRAYNNTSISGLTVFIEKHSKIINDWLPKVKQSFPHSKKGKVDYFQKLKQIVADSEKAKAKTTNLVLKKDSSYFKPDKDTEIAGTILGEKFYEVSNADKGANILRS